MVAEDPVSREDGEYTHYGAVFRVADAVEAWVRDEVERVCHPMEAVKQGVVVDHQADVWRMMASDVGSLWRVDWTRLAEHWVEGDDA